MAIAGVENCCSTLLNRIEDFKNRTMEDYTL